MLNVNLKNKTLVGMTVAFCILCSHSVYSNNIEKNVKDAIDRAGKGLKEAVDKLGDDIAAIQKYLDHYHWKGVIQDEATSGVATLSHMKLNNHKRVVAVKPGERIEGEVVCSLDPSQCEALSLYRVILGIEGLGGQTTVCNYLGSSAGKSVERFVLIAPKEAGVYQVRFRPTTALLERTALEDWKDKNGNEPDGTTTVGIIVVK